MQEGRSNGSAQYSLIIAGGVNGLAKEEMKCYKKDGDGLLL